ncbi:MAG TPA: LytTR family DNA-binding domain-containing protein [Saprospiraceae bacterium]|nr:LytTR family DNA-binding domain-containing protein [Saprospiraceae bacterium]HMQ83231.1 LytTR family DNA-binding domain-containing protein [Saprospiraceae bacterium]
MYYPSAFFTGGAALFLAFAVAQTYFAQSPLRGIYWRYALFLMIILCYFGIQPYYLVTWSKQGESVLFSAAAISYLLFVGTLFKGRPSYPFIQDMVQIGIFGILVCLAVEKGLHLLTVWVPLIGTYIKAVDCLLRGFLGVLGLFFVLRIYLRFPEDRFFSSFLLLGNAFLLLGGVAAAVVGLLPEATTWRSDELREWSKRNRMLIIQLSLFPEIITCSLAILRRQTGDTNEASLQATSLLEVHEAREQNDEALGKEALPVPTNQRKIAFRTGNGFELMKKGDIILIQGGGNGANFIKVFKDGQTNPIIVTQTLAHTLRLLSEDSADFLQTHRSYIVNLQKICRLQRDQDGVMVAILDTGQEVPITSDKLSVLKTRLGLE